MFKTHPEIDDLWEHDAVKAIRENGNGRYRLHARTYGNAVLFNTVVESEQIRLGNVTINNDGEIVLNLIDTT